ncbi:hypothetical protein [Synechococcus sp. CBW1004]|uniref:hypothetical protein n=1 Tax=Synechococcus sp. CBW1004 TaxID=1353136 RepID=UPI0018CEFA6F|nr:hypothetical protein [Synechococcus sp. CBW1004]QPN64305.1 hypothetical protein H8F25_05970 [Synechococcus sp. CBW1004]
MSLQLSNVANLCKKEPYFVYPWGTNPSYGFAAVYSGFIKSLTLCIKKGVGYRFVRVSNPRGIVLENGYNDFFLPVCDEVSGFFLRQFNRDPLPFQAKLPFIKDVVSALLRQTTTSSAQYFLFSSKLSHLPDVSLPQTLEMYKYDDFILRAELANALWKFRPDIDASIKRIITSLVGFDISSDFCAAVIRRGDKILESNYAQLDLYVDSISSFVGKNAPVFIASDDIGAIYELERRLPGYQCFYLHPYFKRGYSNRAFHAMTVDLRKDALLRFLAQVEILKAARSFFATRTTNVSYLVNTLRRGRRVHWVD